MFRLKRRLGNFQWMTLQNPSIKTYTLVLSRDPAVS